MELLSSFDFFEYKGVGASVGLETSLSGSGATGATVTTTCGVSFDLLSFEDLLPFEDLFFLGPLPFFPPLVGGTVGAMVGAIVGAAEGITEGAMDVASNMSELGIIVGKASSFCDSTSDPTSVEPADVSSVTNAVGTTVDGDTVVGSPVESAGAVGDSEASAGAEGASEASPGSGSAPDGTSDGMPEGKLELLGPGEGASDGMPEGDDERLGGLVPVVVQKEASLPKVSHVTDLIQSILLLVLAYTPGMSGWAHPLPKDTTPMWVSTKVPSPW